MAKLYSNLHSNIGTLPVAIVSTNTANNATILGLNICNKTYDVITADGYFTFNNNNFFVFNNLSIDPKTTVVAIGDNQRLILNGNTSFYLKASSNNSLDAIVSYANTEIVL